MVLEIELHFHPLQYTFVAFGSDKNHLSAMRERCFELIFMLTLRSANSIVTDG